jgi:hypothetical protein
MVQILESTKDFDICGSLNPGTVRVSTANSKAAVISSRCAIFRPATAEFRIIPSSHDSPTSYSCHRRTRWPSRKKTRSTSWMHRSVARLAKTRLHD